MLAHIREVLGLAQLRSRWPRQDGFRERGACVRTGVERAPAPAGSMAAVPVSVDPGARGRRLAPSRVFSFQVVDAALEEHRPHRGVAVTLVEAQGEELGVHQDAPHLQAPRLGLQLGEQQATHARAAV